VEIHGAHGYLITQFMSPYINKRTDQYGGSFEGRMRFPLQIVKRIRERVGKEFPIIFRFSADEYVDGGLTLADSKIIAKLLENAGVNAVSITSGIYESKYRIFPTMALPRACNSHLSKEIMKVIDIPVIVAGRINDPSLAEQLIIDKKADLIAMGRPLLADPDLPKKAMEGKNDDIRKCIACNDGCLGNLYRFRRLSCALNPSVGKEKQYRIRPAKDAKQVAIVGGGPAGLEAARLAAIKGHKVTLYEKGNTLGGQLLAASIPEFKKELKYFLEYLTGQIQKLNINIELNKKIDIPFVNAIDYDVLIIATGALPIVPEIPGVGKSNVVKAEDVLLGRKKVEGNIVVAGGGLVGCETALYLSERCGQITIIEKLDEVVYDTNVVLAEDIKRKLKDQNVNILTKVNLEKIREESVLIADQNWDRHHIKADSVVLAIGYRPEKTLAKELAKEMTEFFQIGDCVKPRNLQECIRQAWDVTKDI